jgi:hypothetical protein
MDHAPDLRGRGLRSVPLKLALRNGAGQEAGGWFEPRVDDQVVTIRTAFSGHVRCRGSLTDAGRAAGPGRHVPEALAAAATGPRRYLVGPPCDHRHDSRPPVPDGTGTGTAEPKSHEQRGISGSRTPVASTARPWLVAPASPATGGPDEVSRARQRRRRRSRRQVPRLGPGRGGRAW